MIPLLILLKDFFIGCTKQMKLKKLFRGYMTPVFSKKIPVVLTQGQTGFTEH
jgi:hypothetical protein